MVIFDAAPGLAFAPATPFLIAAERVTIDMELTATGVGQLDWYLEFTSDNPIDIAARWYREVSEDDVGGGVVHMPEVVRDYQVAGAGVSRRSAQFLRGHRYVRLQIRQSGAGGISKLRIEAPFGQVVLLPVS